MGPYRILITGSRDWDDEKAVADGIGHMVARYGDIIVTHGACPTGADAIAERVSARLGIPTEPMAADWRRKGRAAGPARNQRMVDLGPVVVLAFQRRGSRGTADCVRRANAAGIPVIHRVK
ncbi:DUF2493 domain-containing protein [Yinghuangia sp. YIM S09857]|uniref:DUF2493 domain-containing protein n=1 Tax=Yinghuangia sp. YIM S09857 TaxID=3436929 RepID=UPI003F535B46